MPFARSDLASVTVSAAHGGCGQVHARPAPGGKPAEVWELTCEPCSAYLRTDPLWAATLSEVAETPDEKLTREDFEKRGTFDRDAVMAMAMAKLAGVELPETLRRPLTGMAPHLPVASGQVECSEGHPNEAGSRFCGECGSPLRAPAARTCPDGHEVAARAKFCGECGKPVTDSRAPGAAPEPPAEVPGRKVSLKDRRAAELRQMARDRGLDDSGTRAEVLARLQAA